MLVWCMYFHIPDVHKDIVLQYLLGILLEIKQLVDTGESLVSTSSRITIVFSTKFAWENAIGANITGSAGYPFYFRI